MLGIPSKARAAAEAVVNGRAQPVGVARLRLSGPDGSADDIVIFAAGIGFDAAVVERAEREPLRKVWSGPLHYARTTAAVALGTFRRRLPNLRVTAHGRRADGVTAIVQVHDSWTYFGPLKLGLVPERSVPAMTVMVVERMTAPRTIGLVARAAARRELSRVPGVEVWQGVERVAITADPPAWLQADGELLGRGGEVTISMGADPLSVVIP
jgi:diacylglycerol kinase family enzyme